MQECSYQIADIPWKSGVPAQSPLPQCHKGAEEQEGKEEGVEGYEHGKILCERIFGSKIATLTNYRPIDGELNNNPGMVRKNIDSIIFPAASLLNAASKTPNPVGKLGFSYLRPTTNNNERTTNN